MARKPNKIKAVKPHEEPSQPLLPVSTQRYVSTIIKPDKPSQAVIQSRVGKLLDEAAIKNEIRSAHKFINGDKPDYDELTDIQLANILSKLEYEETFNKLPIYYPEHDTTLMNGTIIYSRYKYTFHLRCMEAHGYYSTVLARSGNQCGKSFVTHYIAACHMTGIYPDWYSEEVHGYKFMKPPRVWFGAHSSDTLKKTTQVKMVGEVGQAGSGFIPRKLLDLDSIKDAKRADTPITTFRVKHASGGYSSASLKTYESGRKAWEAETVDLIILDEEPPIDVFKEATARLLASGGRMLLAFTPNEGFTPLVDLLTNHGDFTEGPKDGGIYVVTSTVYEAPHITAEDIDRLDSILPSQHDKDARLRGIPSIGQGMVYPVNMETLLIDSSDIPTTNMVYCMAIDFGWFNTAILHMAYNLQTGIYYVLEEYKEGELTPEQHSQYIQLIDIQKKISFHKICDPSKGAIIQSGANSGRHVASMFNDHGIEFKDADNNVDTGIMTTLYSMQHDRLKISKHCVETVRELRAYSYDKKGAIKKVNDHLCDCLRYCMNEDLDNWTNSFTFTSQANDVAQKLLNSLAKGGMF